MLLAHAYGGHNVVVAGNGPTSAVCWCMRAGNNPSRSQIPAVVPQPAKSLYSKERVKMKISGLIFSVGIFVKTRPQNTVRDRKHLTLDSPFDTVCRIKRRYDTSSKGMSYQAMECWE